MWQRFYLAAQGGNTQSTAQSTLRTLSLFKCIRFFRLGRLMHQFELLSGGTIFRVFLSLSAWILVGHWYDSPRVICVLFNA